MRYLPSTAEGKTWAFSYGKQPKRPGYWYASEGELSDGCFSFMMFQNRTRRQMVEGRVSAQKKADALVTMVAAMKAEGLVKEEQ